MGGIGSNSRKGMGPIGPPYGGSGAPARLGKVIFSPAHHRARRKRMIYALTVDSTYQLNYGFDLQVGPTAVTETKTVMLMHKVYSECC